MRRIRMPCASRKASGPAPRSHIIAMQGPFSTQLNDALYAQLQIAVMVTKDSGEAGGVSEKVLPAPHRGIHVIVIRRPPEESACGENRW